VKSNALTMKLGLLTILTKLVYNNVIMEEKRTASFLSKKGVVFINIITL